MYVCWLCVDCWKLLLVLLVLYHEGANRNVQRTQKTLHVSFLRFLRWSYMFPNQTWLRLDRNAWSADDIQRCKTGALMMSHGCVEIPCRLLAVFAIFAYRKLSLFSDISPKLEKLLVCQRKEWSDLLFFACYTKIDFSFTCRCVIALSQSLKNLGFGKGREDDMVQFHTVHTGSQGSLNYPFWGNQTRQIYGNFEGFPL